MIQRFLGIFLLVLGSFACNQSGGGETSGKPVFDEAAMLKAFQARFPKAEDVEWDSIDGGFQVVFFDGIFDNKAFFDPSGRFQYLTSSIEIENLPAEAQAYLRKTYKEAVPTIIMAVDSGTQKTYQIELETTSDIVSLEFDANGKVLKEQKTPLSKEELQRMEEEGVDKDDNE